MDENVEKRFANEFAKMVRKTYNKALKEAQERDNCLYCHEPYLCLGLAKDIDNEALVYLDVLRDSNIIKFCPVCGRSLSVESYVDKIQKTQNESEEALKNIDGLLKIKQTPAP